MRILHLTTEFPPLIYGGLGTAVGGLVKASARAGLEVAVLLVGVESTPAYAPSRAAWATTPQATIGKRGRVLLYGVAHATAIADAVKVAQWWHPDVVHVHVFWLAHVAVAIRQHIGAPIIYTVHSLDRAEYEVGQGPPECLTQWTIQSALIDTADRILALTENERALIAEYCPKVRGRVRVVGNGIADTMRARKAARTRHAADTVTLLYTGRFVERKGLRELLDAAPRIFESAPGTRLVIAGGHRHARSEDMAAYWLPAACHPFRERIQFTGWLSPAQLSLWYVAADILLVPSWYEPFGMVILEGMLFGLSIIASAVGGPREILVDEYTGLLCTPKDSASLERQVLRLIQDPALRLRLGRNAAREVRSRWLYQHIVQQVCGVYAEVSSTCRDVTKRRGISTSRCSTPGVRKVPW